MKLLIALPALNEEETLGRVLASLPRSVDGVDALDILVVDDGSTDRTGEVAREGGARLARHPRTRGLGEVFNTVLQQALETGADALVTVDADGQFDPAELTLLLEPIMSGKAELATGSRFTGGKRPPGMPIARFWGNRFFSGLLNLLLGERLRDVSCGFRAYSREALLHLNLLGKFTYTQESIFDLVFKGSLTNMSFGAFPRIREPRQTPDAFLYR